MNNEPLDIGSFFRNKDVKNVRNVAIIAHVDHGKTTLTDNLLAEVGMINAELAGSQLATDYDPQQKARGITINSSSVSFIYKNVLVNLIDSPGHIDFNSQVTSALRSVDGAVLLIDGIEGIKTQTETVLGQAVRENIKIVLFVNKIDRMVCELNLDSKTVFEKIRDTISNLNTLIKKLTQIEEDYFVMDKNVIFGSALYKWGLTVDKIKSEGINFKDVLEKIKNKQDLSREHNLAKCVLDKCIEVFPYPGTTQRQKLQRIYKAADRENLFYDLPQGLLNGSVDDEFRAVVTDVNYDKFSGLMYTVRVLSGCYDKKKPLYSSADNFETPLKGPTRILVAMIKKFEEVQQCHSGTVVVLQGCSDLAVGDTLLSNPAQKIQVPGLKYSREAVVSVAIQPKKVAELKKMMDSVKLLVLEDPTLVFNYDSESKEFLLSGVGLLHLEVSLKKLETIYGIQTETSIPVVNYSQTISGQKKTKQVSVRTPNKHNDFNFYVFKLPQQLTQKLLKNEVAAKNLVNQARKSGISVQLAKRAAKILPHGCVYFDDTHGASFMEQCKDSIAKAISLALSTGIKLSKPFKGVGFVLTFAKIHEDNLHRGYIQLRSAFRAGIEEIFKDEETIITEPVMDVWIDVPYRYSGAVVSEINSRRGVHEETQEADLADYLRLKSVVPLAETLDLTPKLMSLSEGRAMLNLNLKGYTKVPPNVLESLKLKKIVS